MIKKARKLFALPFNDLIYKAHLVHRKNFELNKIQISTLLNIKTGGCSEDCAYCAQSAHHRAKIKKKPLLNLEEVTKTAKNAKALGATRLCMGASGKKPSKVELAKVCQMIAIVKGEGLEACVTLGFLTKEEALILKRAGLDYYNHNVDTSSRHYKNIVSTHTFEERLKTLKNVRDAGIKLCCGGILGMNETNEDRIAMIALLASLTPPPESIPINKLIPIPKTPLENAKAIDPFDFVRIIALTRILMPRSFIRLAAGRKTMSDELQALSFFAGANSIFYGDKLLTANNPSPDKDDLLLKRLSLKKLRISLHFLERKNVIR